MKVGRITSVRLIPRAHYLDIFDFVYLSFVRVPFRPINGSARCAPTRIFKIEYGLHGLVRTRSEYLSTKSRPSFISNPDYALLPGR